MYFLRKILSAILCCIALLLSVLSAHAETYWKMYWKPGEYTVEFTPDEETPITGVMEEAIRNSEGTPVRIDADLENAEVQYERYISLFPDGSPIEYEEDEYEDIRHYRWAVGLSDDQSISRDEGWKITLTCYDYEETELPITAWEVAVYTHDGSICGYREVNGVG